MKSRSKFALSAFAGLGVAAFTIPAMAADVVYEEPPAPAPVFEPAPIATWEGPYAGIQLGYGFGGDADMNLPGVGLTNDIGTKGFMGGVFGGYNFQSGSFVYGLEADVNYSDVDGSNAGYTARSRFDGSLRARAGVAVTDDILIYGTAGGAAERQRVSDDLAGVNDTQTNYGYTVGAGVDARLTDQVFARAEYRYTDYGSNDFNLPGVGAPVEVDSSNHRVMVGVGVKF